MGSNVTTITGKEKSKKGAEKSKKGAEKRTNGCGEENKWVRRREQMGAEKRKLGAEKRTNGCGEENKWVRRREQLYFGATVGGVSFLVGCTQEGGGSFRCVLCATGGVGGSKNQEKMRT